MKNRTQEYWDLVGELAQPPKELDGTVERARNRVRRTAPLRRLAAPAASFAAAAAAFVLLVNVFPSFALACSGVPIIRDLTAAVAFSPSLSAAVAHDYVQYIGQSQTVDGVTVRLEYAIVDKHQAVFFYSAEGGQFWTSPSITAQDGEHVGGYAASSFYADGADGLSSMTLSFTAGKSTLPDRFTLEMYFIPKPEQDQASAPANSSAVSPGNASEYNDPRNDPSVLRFAFDVTLDPSRVVDGRTVEVGRWMELDGQRILVDRLELFPTRTILYLDEDSENTAWLGTLKFWFEDGRGNHYDNKDGVLSASGSESSQSYLTYYFQSFYYSQPEHLTLCVDKAEWLEKDAPRVILDLTTGACSALPDGVRVDELTRDGDYVTVKLLSPIVRKEFGQTFGGYYWDPQGNRHDFNQWGGGTEWNDENEEIGTYEIIYLKDYPWDTVELELSYTSVSQYEQPVSLTLF